MAHPFRQDQHSVPHIGECLRNTGEVIFVAGTNVWILNRLWQPISDILFADRSGTTAEEARRRAQITAPVVWLLGKTGAGKTAIIAALSGDPRAQVGEGFEPCTRTASFYDLPPEAP